MNQVILFLLSIAFGIILRVLYFLQRALAIKTDLYPVTVILDATFCAVAFVGFFLMSYFLAYGAFYFFMLAGILAGFFTLAIFLHAPKYKYKDLGKEYLVNPPKEEPKIKNEKATNKNKIKTKTVKTKRLKTKKIKQVRKSLT